MGKTVTGVLSGRLGEGAEPAGDPDPDLGTGGTLIAPPGAVGTAAEPVRETGPQAPHQVPQTVEEAPVQPAAVIDAVLAPAVGLAQEAARELGGSRVGEHLGVEVEGDAGDGPVATHSFATTDRAYAGWRWAVTVARAEGSEHVTVDEVVLLPGTGALLAPAWVPWSERVNAGDLAAGDLLPPPPGDERLVPAWADPDAELADEAVWELGWELGLGRPRVLSLEGRADAAERWWEGAAGPYAPVTEQAPGLCGGCGFLVPLGGALRQAFGVCANAYAPDDGRVVALAHGCGAHSETVVDSSHAATAGMAVEDDEFDLTPVSALSDEDVDGLDDTGDRAADGPAGAVPEVVVAVAPGSEVVLDLPAGAQVAVEVPGAVQGS